MTTRKSDIQRIRETIKPGMTLTDLARKLALRVDQCRRAVSKLRAAGEIDYPVLHEMRPGAGLRASMKGSITIDAAMRSGFDRTVPEDMRAMIDAAVAAQKFTTCKPGGHIQTFPQGTSLYSRVEVE